MRIPESIAPGPMIVVALPHSFRAPSMFRQPRRMQEHDQKDRAN